MKRVFFKRMLLLCAFIVGNVVGLLAQTYNLSRVTTVEAGHLYVFVQAGYAMNNTISSSALQCVTDYKSFGLEGTENYVWTLEEANGGFYMKNVSLTSNSSYLNNTSSTSVSFGSKSSIWSFTFDDDGYVLIQNTMNNYRFLGFQSLGVYKAYATVNLNTYEHDIEVYELVKEGEWHTLSTFVLPAASGEVSIESTAIAEGRSINVTAIPYAGYRFVEWDVSGKGASLEDLKSASTTFTMGTEDATITANFDVASMYCIQWSVDGVIIKTEDVEEGKAIDLSAPESGVPNGYRFKGWVTAENMIDGVIDIDPENYVTSAICTEDATYYAVMVKVIAYAPASWKETEVTDLTADDVFVIVGKNEDGIFAMSNDKGSSTAPNAIAVTVGEGVLIEPIDDNIKWNIKENASGYQFYPNGSVTNRLYCIKSSNNVRVGTGDNYAFRMEDGYLYNIGQKYYIGLSSVSDWRGYDNHNNLLKDQTFTFYKYNEGVEVYGGYCTTLPITVTIPASGYSTVSSTRGLDFANAIDESSGEHTLTAYVIPSNNGINLSFAEVTTAPAKTGILLKGTAGHTYEIPMTNNAEEVGDNLLKAGPVVVEENNETIYLLKDGQFHIALAGTTTPGKAYLELSAAVEARVLSLSFDDDTTDIDSVESSTTDIDLSQPMYNLAGQRVSKSYKGIVIQNGKKFMNQ